jgi:hypothetical protein
MYTYELREATIGTRKDANYVVVPDKGYENKIAPEHCKIGRISIQ